MEHIYRSYYTNCPAIVNYMVARLRLEEGQRVMEPCAGGGAFVDALLRAQNGIEVDSYDINPAAVTELVRKHGAREGASVHCADPLTDLKLTLLANAGGWYDRVIGNPPYGGWQEPHKRKALRRIYPRLYVKETYSLFLYRCVRLLNDGGVLSFIIPDTYLTLTAHQYLRHFLLTETCIDEILLFPSSFFPGVAFGYSKLSIITLRRCANAISCRENRFRVISGFQKVEQLGSDDLSHLSTQVLTQDEVIHNIDHAFFVNDNPAVGQLINRCEQRVGDVASCVTGLYTGDDKAFLRRGSLKVRPGSAYAVVRSDEVYLTPDGANPPLEGLEGPKRFIPIVKGGAARFRKADSWFLDWGQAAVDTYKHSSRGRFQNSRFYFKTGIAVPMVSSSRVTAWLLEGRLFDQSIVGIFPQDPHLLYYLMAFFNSATCNRLIRTINPSANNSANYLKKIPFVVPPPEILARVDGIVKGVLESDSNFQLKVCEAQPLIDDIFECVYGV